MRILLLLALSIMAVGAFSAEQNQLSTEEKKDGFTLLFDGKSLDQWRGYKKQEPHKGWQAVDGTIARVGGGGDLITKKKYRSFDFRFDWKISELPSAEK